MICLERLDGRAFSLPFQVVPNVEMSRRMASSVMTGAALLLPYLLSITDKLTSEILCNASRGEVGGDE